MILFFRFLRVVLMAIIGRRVAVPGESVLHFRVWPTDIDFNLHLNDGRYVSLMGLGRADLLARSGVLRGALKRKWAPVVGGIIIRYRREIRTFARLTLRSRIAAWDEKWIYIEHVVESGGKTCAVGYARGVLRSASGTVPTSEVLALVNWSGPSPPMPDAVAHWPPIEA